MLKVLLTAWLLSTACVAEAGELTVKVRDAQGRPVPDAVVIVHSGAGGAATPLRFSWPMVMSQHDIAFDPHTLIVPVGSDVAFPNRDSVRHHVYSFSAAKKFELKLYGRDETRSVHFDKVGPVALGCNIHDRMAGFIYVVDTPYAAKTDAAGVAVLHEVPNGAGVMAVWHPYMKAPQNQVERPVTIGADTNEVVASDFRSPPPVKEH